MSMGYFCEGSYEPGIGARVMILYSDGHGGGDVDHLPEHSARNLYEALGRYFKKVDSMTADEHREWLLNDDDPDA